MNKQPLSHKQSDKLPQVRDFNFEDFQEISHKTDLLQKEWADLLHISERTLQRYAKGEGQFNFSVKDRILQIDKVLERGKEIFGSYEKFLRWLREEPFALEGKLSLYSMASFDGINSLLDQLGRIEHGILL
jgi:putative toxin-antitoxin system antitoxin component (TIGR02293 family)